MELSSLVVNSYLVLVLGQPQPLSSQEGRVWIENRSILKVEKKAGQNWLVPLKLGFSRLKTLNKDQEVSVISSSEKNLLTTHKLPLGLKADVQQGMLRLQGEVFRFSDLQKLLLASLNAKSRWTFGLKLTPEVRRNYEEFISDQFEKRSLKDFKLQWRQESQDFQRPTVQLPIKKFVPNSQLYEQLGVTVEDNENALAVEPTVKVSITVAEVRKSFSRKLGIKPPTSYTATLLGDGSLDSDLKFEYSLQALESAGHAKILASPNILCRSGKEADFFAGGEFPIKILNYRTQDVVWKKYGINLKVKPVADHQGQIGLTIETEVSSLDPSRSVDDIPSLLTNKVNSHFDLKESRVIALSGLLKQDEGKNSEGWPWLKRIPVLGLLFSSESYLENQTELIIFVKPEVLHENHSDTPAQHLKEALLIEPSQ